MQKTSILFILPEYYPHSGAGISTYYLQYIRALRSSVEKIKVIVGSGYVQADENYLVDEVEIEYLKPEIFNRYFENFSKFELFPEYRKNLAAAWAIWEQAKKGEGFDIIECVDFGLGFIPWLLNHNKAVITRLHGSTGQIELYDSHIGNTLIGDLNRQAEFLLRHSDQLVTHSKANQQFWQNVFPEKKINLIQPVFFNDAEILCFSAKDKNGIVCARIQDWKGPDVLCKAIALVEDKETRIDWYGRDMKINTETSKSEQLQATYKGIWGAKVKPHAPQEHKLLLELQRKSKYAIIPSTWDMYNFTGLEYMSVGTVVICSDGAGVSEVIDHGVNGFKFSSGDVKSLAACIQKVQSLSEADYNLIVKNALQTLSTKLAIPTIIETNLNLYANTTSSFSSKPSNVFIAAMFEPSTHNYKIKDILDRQSFKVILNYLLSRLKKKIND